MRLLAAGLGYTEPWLHESAEDAIRGVFDATRAGNLHLAGVTFERLRAEGTVPLVFEPGRAVPFADGRFPTASGKAELRCGADATWPRPAAGLPPAGGVLEGRKQKDEG